MSSYHKGLAIQAELPSELATRTAYARLLLILIADMQGHNQRAWPSQGRMRRYLSTSRSTVQRTLDDMQALGLISVTHRTVKGRNSTNIYRVHWAEIEKLPRIDSSDFAADDSELAPDDGRSQFIQTTRVAGSEERPHTGAPEQTNPAEDASERPHSGAPGNVGVSHGGRRMPHTGADVCPTVGHKPKNRNPSTTTRGDDEPAVATETAEPFGGAPSGEGASLHEPEGATPAACEGAGEGADEDGSPDDVREPAGVSVSGDLQRLLEGLEALRLPQAGVETQGVLIRAGREVLTVELAAMLALGVNESDARAMDRDYSRARLRKAIENTTAGMIDPKTNVKQPAGWLVVWARQDKPDGPALIALRKTEAESQRSRDRNAAVAEQEAASEAEREAKAAREALEASELLGELQAGGWSMSQACEALYAVFPQDDGRESYVAHAKRTNFRIVTVPLLRGVLERLRNGEPAREGAA